MDAKCYTEVYTILEYLNITNKLPDRIVKNIQKRKDNNYSFPIDKDVPLKFQVNNEDTLALLSYIYLKYICNDRNKCVEMANIFKQNDLIKEGVITKNNDRHIDIERIKDVNAPTIIKKENAIGKLIKKIKALFVRFTNNKNPKRADESVCPNCKDGLMYLEPDGSRLFCKRCNKYYINDNGKAGAETSSPYIRDDVLY